MDSFRLIIIATLSGCIHPSQAHVHPERTRIRIFSHGLAHPVDGLGTSFVSFQRTQFHSVAHLEAVPIVPQDVVDDVSARQHPSGVVDCPVLDDACLSRGSCPCLGRIVLGRSDLVSALRHSLINYEVVFWGARNTLPLNGRADATQTRKQETLTAASENSKTQKWGNGRGKGKVGII